MAKRLRHRLVWTWDHSMDWTPLPRSIQEYGCSDPYYKRPQDFVEDYSRLTGYLGPLGFTGVIVYGFLRDSHGGLFTIVPRRRSAAAPASTGCASSRGSA